MPTAYTNLLGLALPVTGELSGVWGQTVNEYITEYLDAAVAGTQTISGSQTGVVLSKTTSASLVSAGSGATGSSQYAIINCTGNPASMLTITAPATSKAYVVINSTSTSQDVKIVGAGPTTGVTIESTEKAVVVWNGSDFVKVASSTAGGVTGPASATDNAVARFDGTTGKVVQNSAVTIADTTGDMTGGKYNKVTITAPATGSTLTIADGKTLTANNSLTFAGTDGTTMTFPGFTTTVAGTDSTQTLTNKRIDPRVVAAGATSGNLTINGDTTDLYKAEGLTGAITFLQPSGTPVDGQKLLIRIRANGTARAITWTTSAGAFRAVGITLPTTTVLSKVTYVGCVYNATDVYWDVVATVTQA